MGDQAKLLLVVRDPAARSAERVRRADYHGIPEPFRDLKALLHRIRDVRGHDGLVDLLHRLLEELSVLRSVYGLEVHADELYALLLQKSALCKLAAEREAGLPAERGEDAVRLLLYYYSFERVLGERLEIDLVRERRVCHYRRGVRVAKHHVYALVLEHSARLRARVVELGRLPYDNGPRPYDQHFLDVLSSRHDASPLRCFLEICRTKSSRPAVRRTPRGETAR